MEKALADCLCGAESGIAAGWACLGSGGSVPGGNRCSCDLLRVPSALYLPCFDAVCACAVVKVPDDCVLADFRRVVYSQLENFLEGPPACCCWGRLGALAFYCWRKLAANAF